MTVDADQVAPFPSTHWSMIFQAGDSSVDADRSALHTVLLAYTPALRAHLIRSRRVHRQDADDVLQGFLADRLVNRRLLRQANASRGRFRSLVVKAIDNYARDAYRLSVRKDTATESTGMQQPSATKVAPADQFDVSWARMLIGRSLRAMRRDQLQRGRLDVWKVFWLRSIRPVLRNAAPAAYEDVVDRFGLQTPGQAHNLLVTGRRAYNRALRAVVADYTRDPAEMEQELRDLTRILSSAGAGSVLAPRSNGYTGFQGV